jgi:hypothetical protein
MTSELRRLPGKSLSENSVGVLFSRKRLEGEARRGRIPAAVPDRGATKPAGLFLENPPGDGSFARGRRWLGSHSPLRGCSSLAALATAKIPRRRTHAIFRQALSIASVGKGSQGLVRARRSLALPSRSMNLMRLSGWSCEALRGKFRLLAGPRCVICVVA